ncbi:MAG: hypothetical protein KAQ98_06885 [Bacteriovoracaceae bacterium]|nr:hypothetical protein [Bacteriovoracaceae bacterium]
MEEKKSGQAGTDQNFNDSELEDIMSEIESLEKEFVEDGSEEHSEDLKVDSSEITENELQADVDQEMQEGAKETLREDVQFEEVQFEEVQEPTVEKSDPEATEVFVDDPVQEIQEEPTSTVVDNVVPIQKEQQKATHSVQSVSHDAQTEMNFSVSGQMNLKLNFTVGGQEIHLVVNEQEGFAIELGHGIRFSVPLDSAGTEKVRKAG